MLLHECWLKVSMVGIFKIKSRPTADTISKVMSEICIRFSNVYSTHVSQHQDAKASICKPEIQNMINGMEQVI